MTKSHDTRPNYGMVTIQEPMGDSEPALVHVNGRANGDPSPNNPKILCDTGSICAFGTGAGNGRITAVKAKMYRPADTPDSTPPNTAVDGAAIANTHRWKVDHVVGAQSEGTVTTNPQNKLAVWLQFENEPNQWSLGIKVFIGLSTDKTFCESLH